jgi:hypothetical protein
MQRLLACIIIGLFASGHAVRAQAPAPAKPAAEDPKGPSDRLISGLISPDRVKSDQEAFAKKAQASGTAPFPRGKNIYFAWNTMTPAEFDGLGKRVLFLIPMWTQKPEELPVKRVYIRANGQELPVYKVSSWKTPVDGGSPTAAMYGPYREDGFYLVPGSAMLEKGEIVLDLANRTGWVQQELPSNVATDNARRFGDNIAPSNAKPDLKALQGLIARRFPGFPVPRSLP